MNRPSITPKVISGILSATSMILAGSEKDYTQSFGQWSWDSIIRADRWARGMRAWMKERNTWKEPK